MDSQGYMIQDLDKILEMQERIERDMQYMDFSELDKREDHKLS